MSTFGFSIYEKRVMVKEMGTKTMPNWRLDMILVSSLYDIEHVYNIEWTYDVMMTSLFHKIYLWYRELFPLGFASSARSLVLHICKLCNFFAAVLASFACLYTIKHTNKIIYVVPIQNFGVIWPKIDRRSLGWDRKMSFSFTCWASSNQNQI